MNRDISGPYGLARELSESERSLELEMEVGQLKHALASHEVVDQAIGVIVATGHMSPGESFDVLREVSMHTNIKLRHVAELVIEWGRTGNLCADVRHELDRRLAQRRAQGAASQPA
ncbi:ANTAR domain-containing protein [Streptomyces sp. NPDC005507]|uniref:ANTAR domain-containing protein n=1 Tax=Streptomyces sp. NPDC005507 TaxID=3154885 RepID=UPI00339F7866